MKDVNEKNGKDKIKIIALYVPWFLKSVPLLTKNNIIYIRINIIFIIHLNLDIIWIQINIPNIIEEIIKAYPSLKYIFTFLDSEHSFIESEHPFKLIIYNNKEAKNSK